ncbi:MAG TPA: hypothetical protein ENF75_06110 [Acidilobales archaeon]|nr:MAG: hypothetical protein DRO18_02235 [Thermoprotei archaeon]HDD26644.1 hypothetical protein [Acidilobales archaeon]
MLKYLVIYAHIALLSNHTTINATEASSSLDDSSRYLTYIILFIIFLLYALHKPKLKTKIVKKGGS